MKVTEIRKHIGRTIGLANFSSVRFDIEVAARLDKDDVLDNVEKELWDLANEILAKDIARWKEKVSGSTQTKK